MKVHLFNNKNDIDLVIFLKYRSVELDSQKCSSNDTLKDSKYDFYMPRQIGENLSHKHWLNRLVNFLP